MRSALAFAVLAAEIVACGDFGAETPGTAAVDDAGAPLSDAGLADVAVNVVEASAAPCSDPKAVAGILNADALIGPGAPDQKRPDVSVCNMSVGKCLLRFGVTTEVATAFAKGSVFAMHLLLTRADSNIECGPTSGSCTTLRQDGILTAYPLSPDWDEAQVTWKNRRDGKPWSAQGAGGADQGPQAGQRIALATDVVVPLELSPSTWSGPFLDGGVAVQTTFDDGAGHGRQFVTVLRASASPVTPADAEPKLVISYCP